ncbi:MAG TPA: SURF1 family protein [Stenotrophomonas sp.]|jgi:cytochrome oxidase assembly protein ShyY1
MMRHHTRWVLCLLALAVAIAFALLGRWQLERMHEKQALLLQADQARTRTVALDEALRQSPALRWVQGEVAFEPASILLDNQMHEGRAGVRIYQLAHSGAGARLLIDLGWLPLPPDRQLPKLTRVSGQHSVAGMLAPPPSSGLALGPALGSTGVPDTWLATRIDRTAIEKTLGLRDISSQVLRLDPALPLGYTRDLDVLPNTLPPARHLAYAVQWFGLALAVLATAALLGLRARWRDRQARDAAP